MFLLLVYCDEFFIKEGCLNLKFDRRDLGMMNGFMYVVMIVYNEDLIKRIVTWLI